MLGDTCVHTGMGALQYRYIPQNTALYDIIHLIYGLWEDRMLNTQYVTRLN